MITYWKNHNGLVQIRQFEKDCWMNIINPTPSEISMLVNKFKVPEFVLTDVLDTDEQSRLDEEGKWLLIIIRIPIHDSSSSQPFYTIPLGVLISGNFLLTVCAQENDLIREMTRFPYSQKINLSDKDGFIMHLFLRSATSYLNNLKQINIMSNQIEKDLGNLARNEVLQKLLGMEKCLVYFITSLKSNELLLAKIRSSRYPILNDVEEDVLEDVIIENKQAIEMANIYKDIHVGMVNAYGSIISNNLNVIMKRLTVVTIVLAIPTLVGSIFGMNLKNFMEQSNYGFAIAILISVILTLGITFIFRKLKWF
jgi:magnesium transporter